MGGCQWIHWKVEKFSNIVKSWSESANYVLLNCCVILCLSPFPSHLEMITLWLWYTKHTNIHTGLHAWDPRRGVSKLECIYQNMNPPWLEVNTFRLCLSISLRLNIVFVPLVSCHLASIGTHMNTHTHTLSSCVTRCSQRSWLCFLA